MADTKITALPETTVPALGDVVPIVSAGASTKIKIENLHRLPAGTATVAALRMTSGANLTTPVTGAFEYDGVNFYQTTDTTSGRGIAKVEQHFMLTSAGTAITTIGNYFGANSNISLVASAYYEIDIWCYFLKTTASTITWTFTNSAAPTSQNILFEMSPTGGLTTPPGTATKLSGNFYNDTTAARAITTSGSLTTGVNHFMYTKIFLRNGTGTSLKIQATSTSGSITPGIGSHWFARRLSPNNVGTFAA